MVNTVRLNRPRKTNDCAEVLRDLERRRHILMSMIRETEDDEVAGSLFLDYWALRVAADSIIKTLNQHT